MDNCVGYGYRFGLDVFFMEAESFPMWGQDMHVIKAILIIWVIYTNRYNSYVTLLKPFPMDQI